MKRFAISYWTLRFLPMHLHVFLKTNSFIVLDLYWYLASQVNSLSSLSTDSTFLGLLLISRICIPETMDLIGILPDEVLCHILSFLTTQESALTSILSKKWLNLWILVPNIGIEDSVFLHPEEGKRERDGILQSFMGFGFAS